MMGRPSGKGPPAEVKGAWGEHRHDKLHGSQDRGTVGVLSSPQDNGPPCPPTGRDHIQSLSMVYADTRLCSSADFSRSLSRPGERASSAVPGHQTAESSLPASLHRLRTAACPARPVSRIRVCKMLNPGRGLLRQF